MNAGPPTPTAFARIDPLASPLHPASVAHNARVLSTLATLSACFSGLIAGILGLTNYAGFLLYIATAAFSGLTIAGVKCGFRPELYVPQAQSGGTTTGQTARWRGWLAVAGLGQENLLGFLLFWIGGYALIHVYD